MTRLEFTTGPLDADGVKALKGPTEDAMAEESAQIHGLR